MALTAQDVLNVIKSCGTTGATGYEIATTLSLMAETVQALVTELHKQGAIVDTGKQRPEAPDDDRLQGIVYATPAAVRRMRGLNDTECSFWRREGSTQDHVAPM